jgi:hypothetical protein
MGKGQKERALSGLIYMPQIVPILTIWKKDPKCGHILKFPKQLWYSSIFTTSKNVKFEMHKPKTTTTTEPKLFAKCKIVCFFFWGWLELVGQPTKFVVLHCEEVNYTPKSTDPLWCFLFISAWSPPPPHPTPSATQKNSNFLEKEREKERTPIGMKL